MTDNAQDTPDKASKRRRKARPYPAVGLEEVLSLPTAVLKFGGGTGKVRRLTLLESMGKSADSSATRDLITNSSKYGLTAGSFRADFIELTVEGKTCVDPDQSEAARLKARFDRAIAGVGPSSILHAKLVGGLKRALVVVLTDLVDVAAARSLVAAVPVLARHHEVVVAGAPDPALRAAIATAPQGIDDVLAAAVAVEVDRASVRSVRAAGAQVVEAPLGGLGSACVAAYLRAKARARL